MAEDEGSCDDSIAKRKHQREAELHWYEAHGFGRKEFKIKRLMSSP